MRLSAVWQVESHSNRFPPIGCRLIAAALLFCGAPATATSTNGYSRSHTHDAYNARGYRSQITRNDTGTVLSPGNSQCASGLFPTETLGNSLVQHEDGRQRLTV